MDTDSKKLELDWLNLNVSLLLKLEIVLIFLFTSGNDSKYLAGGLIVTAICVFINQFTEMLYVKKTTLRQRLLLLFKSLLIISGILLAFYYAYHKTYLRLAWENHD